MLAVSRGSLCRALSNFTLHLQNTLCHHHGTSLGPSRLKPWWQGRGAYLDFFHDPAADDRSVMFLGHRIITSLGQALANLGATPGTTWADVRAAASNWRELVDTLMESWSRLAEEATRLRFSWEDAATRRGLRAEVALGLLERLAAACDRAVAYPRELRRRVAEIETALELTTEPCPDFRAALEAAVAEAEQLWDASALLFSDQLQGILRDLHNLLSQAHGGHGYPGGPSSSAVAQRCQEATDDVPRLLQARSRDSHVIVVELVSPLQRFMDTVRSLWERVRRQGLNELR
ncbi:uncharacterized protein LOC120511910 isoform X2 [Passer montanus]|nr:uncharacterized protein LOC120511910 isoform X2 [Passer montanus]